MVHPLQKQFKPIYLNMLYYFLDQNGTQQGPVEKETLRQYCITPHTQVWREGMAQWMPASQLPELSDLFAQAQAAPLPQNPCTPSSYNNYQYPGQAGKPASYMWLAILTTLLCCLPAGIVSIVYASKVDYAWAMGDSTRAKSSSSNALTWAIVSLVLGIIGGIIIVAANS